MKHKISAYLLYCECGYKTHVCANLWQAEEELIAHQDSELLLLLNSKKKKKKPNDPTRLPSNSI